MYHYTQNSLKSENEVSTIDLLAAYKLFQGSNKEDFLELLGQNIDRIYKEALCLRELSFAFSDDSVNIFAEITNKVANILQAEKCAIFTFDSFNNEYILESPIFGQTTAPIKLSRIKASSDEVQINEVISQLFESKQVRNIYLKVRDKVCGILAVANKIDNTEFNSEDDYFLSVCAKQVAIIIENNRLYRQVHAQAARESVINRINSSIRSSLDLNTILNTAVKEIGSTLKVSICSIIKLAQDKNIAIVTHEYISLGQNDSNSVGTLISTNDSPIIKQIFETKKPVIINDTSTSPLINNCIATKYRIIDTIQAKSVLSVPIIFEDHVLGTISINQCDRVRRWSHEDIQIVEGIASQLGVAINQASLMSKIKALATKDELTGLINRRNFYERFISEIERVKRHPGYLSFVLFDIDHFKQFNDNYGHLAGDYVLRELGRITAENSRKSDIASRYGGEEFALVLPETTLEAGYELLERLRKKIEETDFEFQGQKLSVTISGGIIQIGPLTKRDIDIDYIISESIDKTDNLLYKAKKSGRNMICTENM